VLPVGSSLTAGGQNKTIIIIIFLNPTIRVYVGERLSTDKKCSSVWDGWPIWTQQA